MVREQWPFRALPAGLVYIYDIRLEDKKAVEWNRNRLTGTDWNRTEPEPNGTGTEWNRNRNGTGTEPEPNGTGTEWNRNRMEPKRP